MKDKFLALSLGQLTNSSIWSSVAEFASLSVKHSYFPKFLSYPYYYVNTTLRYAYDHLVRGSIAKYKKGELDDGQFLGFLKSQLSSSLTEGELKQGWNAMCSMGDKEKANLDALITFLEKHANVTAVVPSHTNPLQFGNTMSQMRSDSFVPPVSSGKIKFVTSFEKHETSLLKLATTAILELTQNVERIKLYSMHRDVKDSISDQCVFACDPFNPNKASLHEHLLKAEAFFTADEGFSL